MKKKYLLIITMVVLLLAVTACQSDAIEVTTPTSAPEPPSASSTAAKEPFYGVGPALKARLEQIALFDSRIQALIKNRDHTFTVDGHTIEDKDYNLAVGVRLKDNVTSNEFREWVKGGREDSNLIDEYVGVLNIGYNEKYYITFDMAKEVVSELKPGDKSLANIPEVTIEEKQRAVKIALADATLSQILESKEYRIAPEGKIGVWHSGSIKLGVAFQISFDRTYTIDVELPNYQESPHRVTGEVEGLLISVLLEKNQVASIVPISPIVEN